MAFSLNDFSNIKKIGEGGMGHVYIATQISLDRKVAIKELASNLDKDPNIIKKFGNEARSAAALDHENIIRIYDFGEDKGSFYISMEFIDGFDLEKFLRLQPLSMEVGLMILLEAAKGLHFAHQHDITHCDVKPGNILISKIGKVKVADFGLAQAGKRKIEAGDSTSVFITPGYMPPEVALGTQTNNRKVDIWAVGVLAYRIIAGNLPFVAPTMAKLVHAIVNDKEKDLQQIMPSLSDELCDAIKNCMQKDPAKRAKTLEPLINALENFIFEMGVRDVDRMIMMYLSNKESSTQMLAEMLVQYHMRKGNDFQEAGNIYKADAHFRQAEKYGINDPALRQPQIPDPKSRTTVSNAPGPLIDKEDDRFPRKILKAFSTIPNKKKAGLVVSMVIVGIGIISTFIFSAGPQRTSEEKSRAMNPERQNVFAVNTPVTQPVPVNNANNVNGQDTMAENSARYEALQHSLTKIDELEKPEKKPRIEQTKSPIAKKQKLTETTAGILKFKVDPPQANIMVDGKRCAMAEALQGKQLGPGGHSIAVYLAGYAAYSSTLTLGSGETQLVNVTLKQQQRGNGSLHVYSYPWAEIYIDDTFQGNAPTQKPLSLSEGDHALVLKRAGFKTYTATIHVLSGEETRIKVQLEE